MELNVLTSDEATSYYTKGHVDVQAFKNSVSEKENDDYGENRFADAEVSHTWLKVVPCNNGEYARMYCSVQEGVKGAFKATIATIG